jgi:hypothetical protein
MVAIISLRGTMFYQQGHCPSPWQLGKGVASEECEYDVTCIRTPFVYTPFVRRPLRRPLRRWWAERRHAKTGSGWSREAWREGHAPHGQPDDPALRQRLVSHPSPPPPPPSHRLTIHVASCC